MPKAARARVLRSVMPTWGTAKVGNPDGTSPTTVTPRATRSNDDTATMEPTTATSTPGIFGSQRWNPMITARDARPTTSAAGTVSLLPTPSRKAFVWLITLPLEPLKPNSFGSWLTTTTTAMPLR
jgi:hypothetical protein